MDKKIEVNITIREEKEGKKNIFIINNEETGIADFGNNVEEAINNFKKSLTLYFDTYPEKKNLFIKKEAKPLMVSRIFL